MARILLADKGRQYRRYRPDSNQKVQLGEAGYQWVLSSCISAIGTDGDDLLIRFQNASTYTYPGSAKFYRRMLQSNSKGKFFWSRIRRPNLPYKRTGKLRLNKDIDLDVTDEELFKDLDKQVDARMTEFVKTKVKNDIVTIKNIFFKKVTIGDLVYFLPIKIKT